MINNVIFLAFLLLALTSDVFSQTSVVPGMAGLPNALVMNDGTKVTNKKQWLKRREELLEFFSKEMYGRSPLAPKRLSWKVFDNDKNALGGRATRRQVTIFFSNDTTGPKMDVLLYIPNKIAHAVPAVIGLNFSGNHTINADAGIKLTTSWVENSRSTSCVVNNRATDGCRGMNASQWPVDSILAHGYALVTAYREDIASDNGKDNFKRGVHLVYPGLQNREDNFGTVAAWAWALSRIMDYLQKDKDIDAKRVAVFGWSRLGKASLWAGATDERFAMVISNESGAGGAKLFRRGVGENIRRLNTVFPHWFCANFRKYIDRDTILPFDQHMMMSLIAPRPLYVASAGEDKGADPEGEFWGAKKTEPVYFLLGKKGLPSGSMPALNQPVFDQVGYHIRPGGHDVKIYDWQQYLKFMDLHFKKG